MLGECGGSGGTTVTTFTTVKYVPTVTFVPTVTVSVNCKLLLVYSRKITYFTKVNKTDRDFSVNLPNQTG